jgi:hypothetical protein
VIIGILVQVGYPKVDSGEVTLTEDKDKAATACFSAAGIYAVIIVLCVGRIWWLRRSQASVEVVG